MTPAVAIWPREALRRRVADYVALGKPRVVAMVLVTTSVGYYLGSAGSPLLVPLAWTLAGTALAAAGTLALNQYMERDVDARMERTRHRPLPDGRLRPAEALAFGFALLVGGLGVLAVATNGLAAVVTAGISVTYLLFYTPLKRVTSLCTLVGAIPGALPPLGGWTAAHGGIAAGGLALFAILFVWQLPHSLAIAMLYKDDYARGGFRLLPVVDRSGVATARQILAHCLVLLPLSLLPTMLDVTGVVYFFGAALLGVGLTAFAVPILLDGSARAARRMLLASVVYLPVLLCLMAFDRTLPPLR